MLHIMILYMNSRRRPPTPPFQELRYNVIPDAITAYTYIHVHNANLGLYSARNYENESEALNQLHENIVLTPSVCSFKERLSEHQRRVVRSLRAHHRCLHRALLDYLC